MFNLISICVRAVYDYHSAKRIVPNYSKFKKMHTIDDFYKSYLDQRLDLVKSMVHHAPIPNYHEVIVVDEDLMDKIEQYVAFLGTRNIKDLLEYISLSFGADHVSDALIDYTWVLDTIAILINSDSVEPDDYLLTELEALRMDAAKLYS